MLLSFSLFVFSRVVTGPISQSYLELWYCQFISHCGPIRKNKRKEYMSFWHFHLTLNVDGIINIFLTSWCLKISSWNKRQIVSNSPMHSIIYKIYFSSWKLRELILFIQTGHTFLLNVFPLELSSPNFSTLIFPPFCGRTGIKKPFKTIKSKNIPSVLRLSCVCT